MKTRWFLIQNWHWQTAFLLCSNDKRFSSTCV